MKFTTYKYYYLLPLMISALLLSSCKKDDKGADAEYWSQLAHNKYQEIVDLTSNVPCDKQDDLSLESIYECNTQYFMVTSENKAHYDRLKAEYLDFQNKHIDALIKSGVIVDYCNMMLGNYWVQPKPIRTECGNDGKLKLITSVNIDIEEAKSLCASLLQEINTYRNALSCTDEKDWYATPLAMDKHNDFDYVPISRKNDIKDIKNTIAHYNFLRLRINHETEVETLTERKYPEGMACVNGKPTVIYK
ncbi:hypothetical protein [Pseudopedobacter beijingensis]|uniref:Uncharacterized protein n=1 Tax=Pseudopedobacter beijingensis TaxID=1207056 RepID=A0ABW4IF90_9SPHI